MTKQLLNVDEIEKVFSKFEIKGYTIVNSQQEFISTYNIPTNDENFKGYKFSRFFFNFNVDFTVLTHELSMIFRKSIFVGDVNFSGMRLSNLDFTDALFLDFNDYLQEPTKVKLQVDFLGTHFLGNVTFDNITSNVTFAFKGSTFHEINLSDFKTLREIISFRDALFRQPVSFQSVIFYENVEFSIISKVVNLNMKGRHEEKINIDLSNAIFKRNVMFKNRFFDNITFNNTIFEGLVDLSKTQFINDVIFINVEFFETCIFSECIFKGKAIFHYVNVYKNLILNGSKFNKGLNLALTNFIGNGSLISFDTSVLNFPAELNKDSNSLKTISQKHKRETYRILKNESIKQNNRIQSLKWHALEMKSYQEEIRSSSISLKYIDEMLILLLSKYSNNWGQSWIRGVSYILCTSLFFFIIYVPILLNYNLDLSVKGVGVWCKAVQNHFQYYPHMLNPAHSFNFMKEISSNTGGLALLIDSLARIFVGFGVYQTIMAFRRFGGGR